MRLVAITKGRSVHEIEALIRDGHLWFGENRLGEIQEKWLHLKHKYPKAKLQFIGRLQSNKVREIVELCDGIISIDRKSIVEALAKALKEHPKDIELLIQVNVSGEEQKGGVTIAEFPDLLHDALLKGLKIKGLMTMPPQSVDPTPYFEKLRDIAYAYGLPELSMGMSDDYKIAMTCGATQVRIGRALFED